MIASNSHSCRNTQQALAGSNQLEKAPVEIIPILSTASALSQVSALASTPALHTQENLPRITKLRIDLFFLENC